MRLKKAGLSTVAAPEPPSVEESPDVVVASRGRITALEADRLKDAISGLLTLRGITGGARVRVTGGNCDRGPIVVQVNLQVGGTAARVQAVTSREQEVLPAIARLDRQIGRLSEPWRPRPWPDRTRRALAGAGDGVITRRKAYELQRATPIQAVAVMDAMDYDAHLFTDADSGEDAVVYRAGPSGLRLARQRRMHPPVLSHGDSSTFVPLIVNPRPTPTLTETAAMDRMRAYGPAFLFFTDAATGRGRLLYRRYDGNLGLITPITVDIEGGST
ncbi:sigma 54 modulation/S30EA ribosomal C-terminal domain-containing protein [Mycobacterium riyadhense]|nr:sigma 54 modulation/S30EA ribosomal C-terminal domain-containing protein [Mycobacterium riyadhense]